VPVTRDKAIAAGPYGPDRLPPTCRTDGGGSDQPRDPHRRLTGCPVYVVHLSTRLGLERIKRAQAEGQRVWCRPCPQYLLLTDRRWSVSGPSPRSARRSGVRRAGSRGTLGGLGAGLSSPISRATTHRGCPRRRSRDGRTSRRRAGKPIPFGAPSLETLAPLAWRKVSRSGGVAGHVAGARDGREPGACLGLWPAEGRDPARRRRPTDDLGSDA